MYPFLLQDWLTLQGSATAGNVTQTELAWLDTSAYLDLVVWVEVTELSGGTFHCAIQTGPTKDEALFMAMNDVTAGGPALATGVQVGVYLRDTALCPLSHWLRWQMVPPAAAWNITFRIWASASQPGGFGLSSDASSAVAAGLSASGWSPPPWVAGGGGGSPLSQKPKIDTALGRYRSKQTAPRGVDRTHVGPSFAGRNPFEPADITHATIQHYARTLGRSRHDNVLVRGVSPKTGDANWNPNLPPGTTVKK